MHTFCFPNVYTYLWIMYFKTCPCVLYYFSILFSNQPTYLLNEQCTMQCLLHHYFYYKETKTLVVVGEKGKNACLTKRTSPNLPTTTTTTLSHTNTYSTKLFLWMICDDHDHDDATELQHFLPLILIFSSHLTFYEQNEKEK